MTNQIHVAARPNADNPIVPWGLDRYEVQRDGRRCAVFDRLEDAEFFCQAEGEIAELREAIGALLKWAPLPAFAINEEQRAAITAARAFLRKEVIRDEL